MRHTEVVLRQIDRLFGTGTFAGLPDAELMRRFVLGRDEAAFAALVERHGPAVYRTCRAVLKDRHDAEDAFQAVFLILVRKGASIRSGRLEGWLHRVAVRVAVQANTAALRRRAQEHQAGEWSRSRTTATVDDDLCAAVHTEVERLPERYRLPLVLCHLEGLTRAEAAERLRWSEGTVRGRLAKGRQILRSRLTRRGLVGPGGLLVAGLASEASATLPEGWVAALVGTVTGRIAAGRVSTVVLANRVLTAMLVARVKMGAVAVIGVAGLVAAGVLAAAGRSDENEPPPDTTRSPRAEPSSDERSATIKKPADDVLLYRGRVVDPTGRPFAGARVYLALRRQQRASVPALATTGGDGGFRFAIARDEFDQPDGEPWRYTPVIAVAEGFGLGLSDEDDSDVGRDLTVRLTADDAPIAGRVRDLEGRPVAGASVRVVSLMAPARGDLTPWLEAAGDGSASLYELRYKYLGKSFSPSESTSLFPAVVTDADGGFRITGAGRERLADLIVEGPSIRSMEVSVLTRPGPARRVPLFHGRRTPLMTFHGATPEVVAAPTRPIEGIVRDVDTGAPIAGATIRSYRLADSEVSNTDIVHTTSNAQGRFRLVGMPPGASNEVVIAPPIDQPYLPSWRRLDDNPGLEPLAVDFRLKRGIWAHGRITDQATGRPVGGSIYYHAASGNPHAAAAPGLRDLNTNGDYSLRAWSGPDGSFRVAVLPGRGLILADASGARYRFLEEDEGPGPASAYVPALYGSPDAFARIDPPATAGAVTCNLTVDSGRTLTGTVLGPDGRALAGTRVYGQHAVGSWGPPLVSETFEVYAFRAPRPGSVMRLLGARSLPAATAALKTELPRTLVFRHDERRLAGWLDLTAPNPGPLTVRLEPWAEVAGRVVDAEGQPLPRTVLRPHVAGKARLGGGTIEHQPDRVATGPDGRFRIEGLAPGLAYALFFEDGNGVASNRSIDVAPLQPGESREVGDILGMRAP